MNISNRLIGWPFSVQPIAAQCWRGRGHKILNILRFLLISIGLGHMYILNCPKNHDSAISCDLCFLFSFSIMLTILLFLSFSEYATVTYRAGVLSIYLPLPLDFSLFCILRESLAHQIFTDQSKSGGLKCLDNCFCTNPKFSFLFRFTKKNEKENKIIQGLF